MHDRDISSLTQFKSGVIIRQTCWKRWNKSIMTGRRIQKGMTIAIITIRFYIFETSSRVAERVRTGGHALQWNGCSGLIG